MTAEKSLITPKSSMRTIEEGQKDVISQHASRFFVGAFCATRLLSSKAPK